MNASLCRRCTDMFHSVESVIRILQNDWGRCDGCVNGDVLDLLTKQFRLRAPRSTEDQAIIGTGVARHALEPGDLVFFNTLGKSNSHVGVYLGDNRFVHAPNTRGVVRIESMDQAYWSKRFDQARRLIALESPGT